MVFRRNILLADNGSITMVRQGREGSPNKHPQPKATRTNIINIAIDKRRFTPHVINQLAQAIGVVIGIHRI